MNGKRTLKKDFVNVGKRMAFKRISSLSLIFTFSLILIWLYLFNYMWFSSLIWSKVGEMKGRSNVETSFAFFADPQLEGSSRIKNEGFYGKFCIEIHFKLHAVELNCVL
jgi:hypothetical protein